MPDNAELVLDTHSILGEGAIWDARSQSLYWVDIDQGFVHVYDPNTSGNRTIHVGQPVGTVVPRRAGGVMLAVRDGFMSLDLETGRSSLVRAPENHDPANRFNDGKCDPAGRFWAGTMETPTHKGALYRLDRDLSVHEMLGNIAISNGLVWSLDKKTMYYIDSPTMKVDAFDYDDASGGISNPRTAVAISTEYGLPDGMTMDAEGKLWVAHWGGWCVCRWDPSNGRLLQTIRLPVSQPSSCAFGGRALDTLYITSASTELEQAVLRDQPKAGGLFKFKPSVRGLSSQPFEG